MEDRDGDEVNVQDEMSHEESVVQDATA